MSVGGHPDAAEFAALSQFLKHTHHPDTPIVAEIFRTSSDALKHPVFIDKLKDILAATIQAGRELVESLEISKGTLDRIGQPLNNPQSLFVVGNTMWQSCIDEKVTLVDFFEKGMKPRPDDRVTTARLDLWLFPFANIYGIFGYLWPYGSVPCICNTDRQLLTTSTCRKSMAGCPRWKLILNLTLKTTSPGTFFSAPSGKEKSAGRLWRKGV